MRRQDLFAEIDRQRITHHEFEVLETAETFVQQRRELVVEFNCNNMACPLNQNRREGARAWPNLDDCFIGFGGECVDYALNGALVTKEMLAQALGGIRLRTFILHPSEIL